MDIFTALKHLPTNWKITNHGLSIDGLNYFVYWPASIRNDLNQHFLGIITHLLKHTNLITHDKPILHNFREISRANNYHSRSLSNLWQCPDDHRVNFALPEMSSPRPPSTVGSFVLWSRVEINWSRARINVHPRLKSRTDCNDHVKVSGLCGSLGSVKVGP